MSRRFLVSTRKTVQSAPQRPQRPCKAQLEVSIATSSIGSIRFRVLLGSPHHEIKMYETKKPVRKQNSMNAYATTKRKRKYPPKRKSGDVVAARDFLVFCFFVSRANTSWTPRRNGPDAANDPDGSSAVERERGQEWGKDVQLLFLCTC